MQKLRPAIKKSSSQKSLTLKLLEHLREAHINGSSDCPEIVSKSLAENIVQLLSDYQAIIFNKGVPALGKTEDLEAAVRLLERAHYNR